jgi:hypothetical protein
MPHVSTPSPLSPPKKNNVGKFTLAKLPSNYTKKKVLCTTLVKLELTSLRHTYHH